MKNVLITGGAGFIGSHLAVELLKSDYHVTVLDNLSCQIHGRFPEQNSFLFKKISGKVRFIRGDVLNRGDLLKALDNVDTVVHLAAETGTGQSMYELERYSNTNVGGTSILLDILANTRNKVKKVLVASSRSIYGEGKYQDEEGNVYFPKPRSLDRMMKRDFDVYDNSGEKRLKLVATTEDSILDPCSFYAITKLFQEQSVLLICKSLGIGAVALRFQNVYGPGQSLKNPYTGLLAVFSNLIRQGKDINVFEDGKESRDFVFIDDVVNSIILSLESDNANGMSLNVGTGIATSVMDIAKILRSLYQIDVDINVTGDFRIGDIRHNYADISIIKNRLNYNPTVTINEGLSQFVRWVQEQPNEDGNLFNSSILEMKEKKMFYNGN
jgi:dTDP-L-rhamnose 4-epimerase